MKNLYCRYGRQWQERLAEVNSDTLSQAVEWLQSANSGDQENATATSLDDAVEQILCQEEVCHRLNIVYLKGDRAQSGGRETMHDYTRD